MQFFDSVRRATRSTNGEGSKKKPPSSSQAAPPSPFTSTAGQPLASQSNPIHSPALSVSASDDSESGSSSSRKQIFSVGTRNEGEISRTTSVKTGRSERSNTVSSLRARTVQEYPLARQSSPERSLYSSQQDLYTRNVLNSFSFGAASSTASPARSIDPLAPHDDADSDDFALKSDITPRPSVAGPSARTPPSQPMGPDSHPTPRVSPQRRRRISNTSTNTFGTSSASASATSLSSNPVEARHGGFITTPQTSANESTSDDDESEHRHPLNSYARLSPTSTQYTYSDEEFDEDYDDDRSEPDIEVSSEIHEDFADYTSWNPSRQSIASSSYSRKRSWALPIPSSSADGRDREDSIATFRRPSRSLEGLRSDSLEQSHYQASNENRPEPVSPTSMPESEVDWRDVRRRSIQKDKQRATQTITESPTTEETSKSGATVTEAPPAHSQPSALEGFDASWATNAVGIVDVDWDLSEMADIVGGFQGPPSSGRGFRRDSASTVSSARRLSTTSTSSDPFTRHLKQSGGQHYADERAKWIFVLDTAGGQDRRGSERERSGLSNIFGGRSTASSTSMIGSSAGFHDAIAPFASRDRPWGSSKAKDAAPWRGMAPEAEEWWSSGTNGRYKVVRKNQASEGKAPQQRLHIVHHRNNPYSQKSDKSDGPSITIHRHSKAAAFSISRHYRPKTTSETQGRPSGSRMPISVIDRRRATSMILLASRKVQEAYTSTTTTRKLESHGLLNENGRHSARDRERLARLQKEEEEQRKREAVKERQRQKELKKLEKSKGKGKEKEKNSTSQPSMSELTAVASSSESSNGSVLDHHSHSAPSAALSSQPLVPRPNPPSVGTASSDRTITVDYRRRGSEVLLSDDDDDILPRPGRTTHAEAYATLPPEVLETLAHESHGSGLFGWGKKTSSLFARQMQNSYKPPWPTTHPRFDRRGIVEDLNTSFQDVGLLPAVDEVKASQKRKQRQEAKLRNLSALEPRNVFTSFAPDLLYMLIPLWPGETDAASEARSPFTMPHIPVESRLYLLLYYTPQVAPPPPHDEKGKKNKKSSRSSPTSSRDATRPEKAIFYERFHFSAKIVTYGDIQGSGVRSPDAGLSVIGPLQEAYETMPTRNRVNTEFIMIGWCSSRDKGIEFIPEGLEKLGLADRVLDPNAPPKDDDTSSTYPKSIEEPEEPDHIHILTPMGRAVVEMAWLGSMALTSFG